MKDFFKTVGAVVVGMIFMGILNSMTYVTLFLIIGLSGSGKPSVPHDSVLMIDMSKITLAEQGMDANPVASIYGQEATEQIGVWDATTALENAANDDAIDYICIKADGANGGIAQMEEFRKALVKFHESGKPIIAYTENPSNGSYYIASAADKVFMTSYQGGMNTLVGVSTQVIFLKDILDKLGVNVQLIRHGKYKSAGEMYIRSDISAENRLQYETFVNSMWTAWAGDIAESRGISKEKLDSLIDNLALNLPEDFLDAGLVDELLDKAGLEKKIADYAGSTDYSDVSQISLADYIVARQPKESPFKDQIAVVYVDGEIVDGNAKQEVAGDRFARILSGIRKDDNVKAVVFRVNSPGGSVLASEKIKTEVDRLAEVKPVIASYGSYAASGGYWISNSCKRIFSDKSTLTGSIGVFSMIPDFSKTAKDLAHVNIVSISSNKHGDMYSLMRPLSNEETAYMQKSVETIYEKFVNTVAEGRSLEPEYVDSIAQGRVWAGTDALQIGLVDEIGTLEDAIRYAALVADTDKSSELSNYTIKAYPAPQTALETIIETLTGTDSEEEALAKTPFKGIARAYKDFSEAQAGEVYARMPYQLVVK